MCTSSASTPLDMVVPESFSAQDLYDLQRRQGKPAFSPHTYKERVALRAKFRKQDEFNYAFIRSVLRFFQDFGSVSSYFMWSPFPSGISWLKYALLGSSAADNIVSGRERISRLNPTFARDWRDVFERQYRL